MSSTLPELSTESLNYTSKRHTFNKTIAYVPHNTTEDKTVNNNNNKYSSNNKINDKEKQSTTILHSKRALGWHSAIGANVDSPLPSTTVNKNYTTTNVTGEGKAYNKEHMSDANKMNRICHNNDNHESDKTNFVNQYNNSNDSNTKKYEKHNREEKSSSNNKNAVKSLEEDTLLSEFELPVITNIASPTVTSEGSSAASSWSTSKAATGTTTTTKVNKHHSRDAEAFRQNMTDFLNVMYQGSISPTYLQSMKPNNNSKNSINKATSFSRGKSHTSHTTTTTNVPVSDKWSTSNALVTFTPDDATRPKQTANIPSPSSPPLFTKQSATNEKKLAADTIVHTTDKEANANADTTHSTNSKITTKIASENTTQSSFPPFSPKTRYEDNIDALVNHLVRVLAHSNINNSSNNINNNNNNKLGNWSGSNKRSSQSSSQSELSPLQFQKTVQWSTNGDKEEQKEYYHEEQSQKEDDRQSLINTNAETEKVHVHKYKNREWLNAEHLNSPSNALNTTTTNINNNNNNNNYNVNKKGKSSKSDNITNTDITSNANALTKNKILSRSQLTLSRCTSPSSSPSSPSSHKATSPTARQWNVNTDVSQFVGQAMDNMFGNVSLYGASIIHNHSSRSVLSTLWTDPNFAHLISFETKSHLNTADNNAFYDGNEDSEEESMTVVPIHVGTQATFQPITSQAQLSVSKSLEMPLYLPHVTNHHNTLTSSSSTTNNINISLNSLNSKCVPHNKSSTIPAMATPTEGKNEKRTITSAEERAMSAVQELKLLNAQSKTATAAATALVPDLSTCANNKLPEHESKNEEETNIICQNETYASRTKRNDIQNNTNTHLQCKKSLQSMSLNSALLLNKTNNINTNADCAACRNNKENKNRKEMLVERQDSWAIIDAQMKQSNNNTDNNDGNKNKNYRDDLLSLQSMQEHQANNKYGINRNNVDAKEKQQQEEQKELYKGSKEAILDAKHHNNKAANNTSQTTTTMSTGVKQQQDAQGAKLSISKNNSSSISSKGTRKMSNRLENSTDLTKLIDDEALSRNVLVAVERQLRNYIQLITSEKM